MKNEYFNMICQKAPEGKMIIMAVVPDNLLGEGLPPIFEVQAESRVQQFTPGPILQSRLSLRQSKIDRICKVKVLMV